MGSLLRTAGPVLALLLLWPVVCFGHGVNVFCWAKEDTVQCRARFSGGRAVHNGTWRVIDSATGDRLISGTTDSRGRFAFSPPLRARSERRDLKVICEASMGHQDSWLVRAGDYIQGLEKGTGNNGPKAAERPKTDNSEAAAGKAIREETIRRIVRQELTPLRRELAELRNKGVGVRDVLGGVGYILGLFGIWALAARRRTTR